MMECAWCGKLCNKQIGIARELKTDYWGGSTGRAVIYSKKLVNYFCSDQCRTNYLVEP